MPKRRRTVARHARLTSPHPIAQLLKILAVAAAVVLVSATGVAAYTAYDLTASFTADAVQLEDQPAVPPDIGQIEGGVNLLIAGTDACEPQYEAQFGNRCTGPDSVGERNDVTMLVHISDNPRRVTVISFPRDLVIPIAECTQEDGSVRGGGSAMINVAYETGGLGCVVKTVSQLSGLDIPFAAKVTWGGVIQITDAIGGVDVCLAKGIRDADSNLDLPAGMNTISGATALAFLRVRHAIGDGSDLSRIGNQQQYMSRLARKLVSEDVLSNPATLYRLATTALDNVTPSTSLTNPLTLVQIALAVKDVPYDDIAFLQYPVADDPSDPNRVIPNRQAAADLWAALESNQPLVITGQAGSNGGVVVVTPTETPSPPAGTATPDATPSPTGTAATPTETPQPEVTLPSSINGSTAAEETCSVGNVRG